jgi:hypothetical protein
MQAWDSAIAFLEETARYFENRPTGGEDRAHWANVYNAATCREIAAVIKESLTCANRPEIPDGCSVELCRMKAAQAELNALGVR